MRKSNIFTIKQQHQSCCSRYVDGITYVQKGNTMNASRNQTGSVCACRRIIPKEKGFFVQGAGRYLCRKCAREYYEQDGSGRPPQERTAEQLYCILREAEDMAELLHIFLDPSLTIKPTIHEKVQHLQLQTMIITLDDMANHIKQTIPF